MYDVGNDDLVTNDGVINLVPLSRHDPLMRHDATVADIRAYIRSGLESTSPGKLHVMALAFLGQRLFDQRHRLLRTGPPAPVTIPKDQDGGNDEPPPDTKLLFKGCDFRICNVMALADCLHDFCEEDIHGPTDWMDYERHFRKGGADVLPEGLTLETVANRRAFMDFMTSTHMLKFGSSKPIVNPLNGMNFMSGMFKLLPGKYNLKTVKMQVDHHRTHVQPNNIRGRKPRFAHAEMWCVQDTHKVLRTEQLNSVCATMRKFFGNGLDCIVDQKSLFVPKLALQIEEGMAEFHRFYCIESLQKQFESASEELKGEIKAFWSQSSFKWTSRTCDATMFDAEDHFGQLDDRDTGDVFHPASTIQVNIGDATDTSYRVTVDKKDGTEPETKVLNNFKGNFYWTNPQTGVKEFTRFSKRLMHTKYQLTGDPTHLAMKRAGDWGMVEHCKDNCMVLVTSDQLLVLYALFRGVRVLYFDMHGWVDSPNAKSPVKALDDGAEKDFVQYSFVLCDPPPPGKRPEKWKEAMQGGGMDANFVGFVAAVVMVAFCFL